MRWRSMAMSAPRLVDHVENVALGILKGHEVLAELSGPRIGDRAKRDEACHLALLVRGVQIEMEAILANAPFRDTLERDIDVNSVGIAEHCPAVFRRISGNVAKRRPPERVHRREVVAVDHH